MYFTLLTCWLTSKSLHLGCKLKREKKNYMPIRKQHVCRKSDVILKIKEREQMSIEIFKRKNQLTVNPVRT
jgi:hypothetical protein